VADDLVAFMRRPACGDENHFVQGEVVDDGLRTDEVPQVGRVEGTAE